MSAAFIAPARGEDRFVKSLRVLSVLYVGSYFAGHGIASVTLCSNPVPVLRFPWTTHCKSSFARSHGEVIAYPDYQACPNWIFAPIRFMTGHNLSPPHLLRVL